MGCWRFDARRRIACAPGTCPDALTEVGSFPSPAALGGPVQNPPDGHLRIKRDVKKTQSLQGSADSINSVNFSLGDAQILRYASSGNISVLEVIKMVDRRLSPSA